MNISRAARYASCVWATAAILAGCSAGGSQVQLGPSAPIEQNAAQSGANAQSLLFPFAQRNTAITVHPDRGRSWVAPDAKRHALIYVSDYGTGDVYILEYKTGNLEGTLTGFSDPFGMCVDKAGDVFIANYVGENILEYAHGGSSPIANLDDTGYLPKGCSVDPTTGNLAVTNYAAYPYASGNLSIYQHAQGTPKPYTDPNFILYGFCGYDNKGNLFVDGYYPSSEGSRAVFAELPSGETSFRDFPLNQGQISQPGGVMWDGKYVAVENYGGYQSPIYQFQITSSGAMVVGSTPLQENGQIFQFGMNGRRDKGQHRMVIAPEGTGGELGFWDYPAGGIPTRFIYNLGEHLDSVTVSEVQK
jgi:hypothetical protein